MNANTSTIKRPVGFSPQEISSLINKTVISQHAEDAAFQWILRDGAVSAPNYSIKELADLDERVEANLDGLRVAGDVGWKICEQALDSGEPGEVFAAAVLAFESRDEERIQKVLDVGCSTPESERALISALGWIPFNQSENSIKDLLNNESPVIRRVGIAAVAIHRKDPGLPLQQAISASDARLRAQALKAVGELGKKNLLPELLKSLSDEDEGCRFFAAWSAARHGNRTDPVLAVLRKIAEANGPYAEHALTMILRCINLSQAKTWLKQIKDVPNQLRLAVLGSGIIGDPDMVDDLITLMKKEEVARVAGESFSMITGVDLEYQNLEGEEPEDFEGGPNEEPDDENVAPDPDEDLPWPDSELIAKWWTENHKNFKSGVRYLRGKEISLQSLNNALVNGNQRQRAAAALELALRNPTQPLFQMRAPGKIQLKEMSAWTR